MIEQEARPCSQGLDSATLSALHDEALPAAELRHLREHAATCESCQTRLAGFERIQRALRRQPELEPGNRIWLAVQERATNTPGERHDGFRPGLSGMFSPASLRGLAAAASILLVVGLLAAVLANAAGSHGGTAGIAGQPTGSAKPTQPISSWVPVKPTFPPTATPAFPTPTLPPTSPALTPEQAWGANTATLTLNTQLDATHVFFATAISPDAQYLFGYTYQMTTSNAAPTATDGYYDIAARQFTSIGITQSATSQPECCTMDGHVLLVTIDTAPGTTCGACHLAYDAYDLDTKALWQFAKGTDYGMVGRVLDDHGLVILSTGQGIKVVDLATKQITPLQIPISNPMEVDVFAYTWPYLVYTYSVAGPTGIPAPGHLRAHDLSTGGDIELPQTDALQESGSVPGAIVGQTLFLSLGISNDPRTDPSETGLYEDDAFFSSNSAPTLLASVNANVFVQAANARLVDLGEGIVWDRTQRFVQLATGADAESPWQFNESLVGHYLVTMQPVDPSGNSQAQTVTIYDTDTLPTTPSA